MMGAVVHSQCLHDGEARGHHWYLLAEEPTGAPIALRDHWTLMISREREYQTRVYLEGIIKYHRMLR